MPRLHWSSRSLLVVALVGMAGVGTQGGMLKAWALLMDALAPRKMSDWAGDIALLGWTGILAALALGLDGALRRVGRPRGGAQAFPVRVER